MAAGWLDPREAARILAAGGVILADTDTLPGFHCRADRPEAVGRIASLKGRPADKAMLVLAADFPQAGLVLGCLNRNQRDFCRRCWPGPYSLVLPAAAAVPVEVTAGSGTVAVRVPDLPPLVEMLRLAGVPLVSTSCNRTGRDPARDLAAAEAEFGDQVDGSFACAPAQDRQGVSSALADVTVWPPRLLRPGPQPLPEMS